MRLEQLHSISTCSRSQVRERSRFPNRKTWYRVEMLRIYHIMLMNGSGSLRHHEQGLRLNCLRNINDKSAVSSLCHSNWILAHVLHPSPRRTRRPNRRRWCKRLASSAIYIRCQNPALRRLVEVLAHPTHASPTHQHEDKCGKRDDGGKDEYGQGWNCIRPAISNDKVEMAIHLTSIMLCCVELEVVHMGSTSVTRYGGWRLMFQRLRAAWYQSISGHRYLEHIYISDGSNGQKKLRVVCLSLLFWRSWDVALCKTH